jgi:hypothetical protein
MLSEPLPCVQVTGSWNFMCESPSRYHSLRSANRNETMVSEGNLPHALVVMLQKTHWKEEHKVACVRKKATYP